MESRQDHQKEDFKMNIAEIITETIVAVNKLSQKKGYNRYIKKYPIEKMFMILMYQQYSGLEYGRSLTVYLDRMIGTTTDILSQSELSKKLSYRLPVEPFKEVYEFLLSRTRDQKTKKIRKLMRMIRIIDSTALPASLAMKYAKHRRNKNGFKMHTVIDEKYFPDSIRVKHGRSSDKKSLKWAVKEGYIHLFDRGYNDYSQFQWISDRNAHFVTRALSNIQYRTIRNKKVGHVQKEYGIISDKYIEVIKNRKSDERLCLRMVTFRFIDSRKKSRVFSLLTDLMEHRSDDIARLYRERWNIEVVFRWLKTFLKFDHWLSRSKNGVLIQIYTALCAYLMALIAKMGNQQAFQIMKDVVYEFIREFEVAMNFSRDSNIEEIFLESS
jgi:IS4 transposase